MNKKIIVISCIDCKFKSTYMGGVCDHPSSSDKTFTLSQDDLYIYPPEWCPLPNDIVDDPLLDNTDFAHPAFWRGQLSGVHGACKSIEDILDGKDDGSGVVNDERLEKLRRHLLVNILKLNVISKQQDVILEQQVAIIRGLA